MEQAIRSFVIFFTLISVAVALLIDRAAGQQLVGAAVAMNLIRLLVVRGSTRLRI